MPNPRPPSYLLLIAGSDSSGGAGIQADLRTAGAFGLHALSVITAVTAQGFRGVTAIHPVPGATLRAQILAAARFPIGAVKIGMLGSPGAVAIVTDCLRELRATNIVLDPVLAASSGTALLTPAALRRLRSVLLPLCDLLTPNLPEAEMLLGRPLRSVRAIRAATNDLVTLGARAVLLKGGHGRGRAIIDYFNDGSSIHEFAHERLPWQVRGTGCTLASAVASGLALGFSLADAVDQAEQFLQQAMRQASVTGTGNSRLMSPLPPAANARR
jgi:hydroxymethylpyrimidine/phosphomethylpyrimidine kinase